MRGVIWSPRSSRSRGGHSSPDNQVALAIALALAVWVILAMIIALL